MKKTVGAAGGNSRMKCETRSFGEESDAEGNEIREAHQHGEVEEEGNLQK